MKKRWLILIAILLAMAAASYAAARLVSRPGVPPGGPPCPGFAALQDYLQLTPDQRTALAGVDARYGDSRPRLRDEFRQARDELVAVLHDPNSTEDQAIAAVKRFGTAQQAMQLNTVSYTFELRKHLTEEQKERMVGLIDRGMCVKSCGPGPGMGWGGPKKGPHGMGRPGPKGPAEGKGPRW